MPEALPKNTNRHAANMKAGMTKNLIGLFRIRFLMEGSKNKYTVSGTCIEARIAITRSGLSKLKILKLLQHAIKNGTNVAQNKAMPKYFLMSNCFSAIAASLVALVACGSADVLVLDKSIFPYKYGDTNIHYV